MDLNTEVTTDFDYENQILTFKSRTYGILDNIIRQHIDFKEEYIIKALISLGWKPPNITPNRDTAKYLECAEEITSELNININPELFVYILEKHFP